MNFEIIKLFLREIRVVHTSQELKIGIFWLQKHKKIVKNIEFFFGIFTFYKKN